MAPRGLSQGTNTPACPWLVRICQLWPTGKWPKVLRSLFLPRGHELGTHQARVRKYKPQLSRGRGSLQWCRNHLTRKPAPTLSPSLLFLLGTGLGICKWSQKLKLSPRYIRTGRQMNRSLWGQSRRARSANLYTQISLKPVFPPM